MRGFLATTDQDWFEFLSQRPDLDEVNFWAPSGNATLKAVPWGSPFFFKLKSPHHAVGGFGFLGPITSVPLTMAWDAFGEKNGAATLSAMRERITHYTRKRDDGTRRNVDPPVGCRTILQPTFFPRDLWVEAPRDWAKNIVQGKTYDLTEGEGKRLWDACQERARALAIELEATGTAEPDPPRWGAEQIVRPRMGQGSFRLAVTDAYGRACAVTGEHSLPVLDSAHIRPYAEGGSHEVRNGILLRTDIHRLYDRGYVTITPDLEFKVSDALRDEFDNGRVYYEMEVAGPGSRRVAVPESSKDQPDRELLAWHGEEVFRG